MSLWDQLPAGVQNGGAADGARPLLQALDATDDGVSNEDDGAWHNWSASGSWPSPVSFDPGAGGFSTNIATASTPLEFPDPTVTARVGLHLDGAGNPDGGWRVILEVPRAIVRLPFLRGADLDAQGQLRANGQTVRITLPGLRIQAKQLTRQSVGVELLSATVTNPPVDQLYELIRMEPSHALIGPSDVVGFAFRTAVLDLTGEAGPDGVPPGARAMPADWQGLWLPEARLFVAPTGLEGLAVSAGVRDLWIGFGVHAGVTGTFGAEVVNRGGTPTLTASFRTGTGRWIPVPDTGAVLLSSQATLFVDAHGGIAPVTVTIDVGGTVTTGDRVDVTVPAAGTVSITITATDGGGHATTRTFDVSREPASPPGGTLDSPITLAPTSTGAHRMVLVSQTTTDAVLRLEPEVAADWSWAGGSANAVSRATVPIAAGGDVAVTATITAAAPSVIDAFFLFDRPDGWADDLARERWAKTGDNMRAGPAGSRTAPSSAPTVASTLPTRLTAIGAGTAITVQGYASYEGFDDQAHRDHNQALSKRRRDALIALLEASGFTNVAPGASTGHAMARDGTSIDGIAPAPPPADARWWRARATTASTGPETITGRLRRPNPPPTVNTDPAPPATGRPDCFRKLGVRVELLRGTFIRAEVYGQFDIETAAETALRHRGQPPLRQGPRNPMVGVCDFLVRLRVAADRESWLVSAELRAAEGDLDGLAMMDESQANPAALDVLGALSILAPLSSATAELTPAAGTLVALGSLTLGGAGLIDTKKLVLRGAELVVSQGIIAADGSTTVDDRGTQVSVLLDIETTFTFDLDIVRVNPAHPVTTRYKAIGVRSSWNAAPGPGGQVDFLPIPVFDPSRGYTLDIPTGALSASPPLDELLRILGFRVSRDNPTFVEVEVGLGVDLGILDVESVRVRARIDGPPFDITLTKLVASLEVPGVLHGRGSLEFTPLGFKGAFDLTVVPLNIRATAVLALESRDGVTGVLVGVDVEFPAPLPLGNSGLGIYGFLGGVGANYARNEAPFAGSQVPALHWLGAQLPRVGGVMDPTGWSLTPGSYAFAAGLLLGTVDGGFVVHLKGVVLIEVPGPRLLLIMKADVLKLPPALKSASQNATFLAVLDIDFGRGTITVGVVAGYEIQRLLKIRVPVTAFFDTNHPENWLVDLGTYDERVTVEVLDVITGSGYLMVHGNGLSIPGLPPATGGMAVGVGFHISCILMGSRSAGLYLEVAAGFDAILGLDPFFLAGKIYARGELRLFIVSIGVSAELDVIVGRVSQGSPDVTYLHGEVCGKVNFFFFSVEGCVSLTIGSPPSPPATPPPLVAGVSLVSRSPALLEGTATDRAVDGKLGDAPEDGSSGARPSVPLDAVPVVLFSSAPVLSGSVLGGAPVGTSGAPAGGWVRLGDRWWTYDLVDVKLVGALTSGSTPSAWWAPPTPADPARSPALALLSWLPTPFSRAVPYGEALTESVSGSWGTVCSDAAPPAPVLWTFDGRPLGPSASGWQLPGVPWPDPPGTVRSAPVGGDAVVTEPWRCGDPAIDLLAGVVPAVVVGDAVRCDQSADRDLFTDPVAAGGGRSSSSGSIASHDDAGFLAITEALAAGVSTSDLTAAQLERGWDPDAEREKLACDGRILRSPDLDTSEPAPLGSPEDVERVEQAWDQLGHKPHPLRDAVRLRADGGLSGVGVLLLVPEEIFVERLVVAFEDAAGGIVHSRPLTFDDRVTPANPIPAEWLDPGEPWADPVLRALQVAARIANGASFPQAFVALREERLPDEVVSVVVGWDGERFGRDAPPIFHVVAVTGELASERWRSSWDDQVVSANQSALDSVLTQDPDDHALLTPGTQYAVEVTWRAASVQSDARPGTNVTPTFGAPTTQRFRFTADGTDRAPKDLGAWILATSPGLGETGVFRTEPIRVALATQNVAALFAAYDKELQVVVHAASGKHPAPPGGSPGSAFTVPLAVDGVHLKDLTALTVLTPWEEAVRDVASTLECVHATGTYTHHTVLELPYDFEPLTDYLVDVHAVPTGGSAGPGNLVHRVPFTTGRFHDESQLAALVAGATWEHAVVTDGTALGALPAAPTGDQLDGAFQAAGLRVPQVPSIPRVQVLWSADATPQPVAVVVEGGEALWRTRDMPEVVPGPPDASDPTHHWWAARPREWLSLAVSGAGGALPAAVVTRIVRGPGSTRAVVLLDGGSRGAELRLDLVRAADPLAGTAAVATAALRLPLLRAPWEVEE
jgi:large repetitive protein